MFREVPARQIVREESYSHWGCTTKRYGRAIAGPKRREPRLAADALENVQRSIFEGDAVRGYVRSVE